MTVNILSHAWLKAWYKKLGGQGSGMPGAIWGQDSSVVRLLWWGTRSVLPLPRAPSGAAGGAAGRRSRAGRGGPGAAREPSSPSRPPLPCSPRTPHHRASRAALMHLCGKAGLRSINVGSKRLLIKVFQFRNTCVLRKLSERQHWLNFQPAAVWACHA